MKKVDERKLAFVAFAPGGGENSDSDSSEYMFRPNTKEHKPKKPIKKRAKPVEEKKVWVQGIEGKLYEEHSLIVSQGKWLTDDIILAAMRMDHQTLMAALLHDVIEDTQVAKSTLGNRFGDSGFGDGGASQC